MGRWLVGAVLLCAAPAAAQAPGWPSERPPAPLPARRADFPPYEVRTLTNGLQVVVVLHHEQPAVSMRLLVRAGSVSDPRDKPGVATLTAALLDQGTTSRTAQQIADTIDYIGGGLGTGAGSDLSFVNVIVMKDSFELAMGLLAEIVRRPAFAPEEIERQRQQILSGLKVSYEDPDYVAGMVFDRLVYGFHPYGRPENGTPESIARITRADLQAFHQAYFAPNNAILAIVGDVTAEEAFKGAEKAFGDWPRQEIAAPSLPDPPQPTRRVIVVDRPGAVQTEIRAGHLGVPRKHVDFMALNLAIKILGGEGSNRLHRVLRSERGLTYAASADMNTLKHTGDFMADTETRSEATAQALRLTIEEFWRLQRERVHPRELGDAQAYLAGSFPLTIETPDAIAMQVLNVLFYGLDLEELETFRERVNAVTVDDIQRVARAYLKPDRLSIVLVGDASRFVDELRGVGIDSYERVPLAELDLTTADFRRAAAGAPPQAGPAAPPASPPDERRARAIVARAIDAKGGLEKLRAVRTVTAKATTTVFTPQGTVKTDTVTYIEYPDRFRVEAALPMGRIVQVYAGGQAWIDGPTGAQEAPPPVRDEFRASVQRDVIPMLLRAAAGELRMRPLPAAAEDGRAVEAVELSAADLDPVRLYVEAGTGLILKQAYQTRGAGGAETTEELFSDYRPVDGLTVAFKAVVRRGGATVIERNLTAFTYNTALDGSLFKKPSGH